MKKIIIVQHRLLHYRVELFQRLKNKLTDSGVEIELACGQPSDRDSFRKDEGLLVWVTKVRNVYLHVKNVELIFQVLPLRVISADLVVLMQENRILSNYFVIVLRWLLGKKTAYWGHGYNMQSTNRGTLREHWKKLWLKSVHWWFAYTSGTSRYLQSEAYPKDRITVLNNAIDVAGFMQMLNSVSSAEIVTFEHELGITPQDFVAVFCGSIYKEKKIGYMLDECIKVHAKCPWFKLIVIGAGPDQYLVENFSKEHSWVKYVGVKKGKDKATAYNRASIMLNPGLVGLHILDSFAAGTPIITTSDALHSPEFEYLENNSNGVVVSGGEGEYGDAILRLINDQKYLNQLSKNAKMSASIYTLDNMVDRFYSGILKAMES